MPSTESKHIAVICRYLTTSLLLMLSVAVAWIPDSMPPNDPYGYDQSRPHFFCNTSDNYFKILEQSNLTLLIGARNEVYNISLSDLREIPNRRIEWNSSLAHREMCLLKGKTEAECQNFVRVFGRISATEFMMCGTNSYKPLCRKYVAREDVMDEGSGSNEINPVPARILEVGPDIEAQGQCPYSPQHNSSYVFAGGQLFSATVADFQSNDPLIYREPQRTDQFDLMQLNQPAFVRVVEYASHVLVFFREVAMEYMNLGKAVYSRVARVCRNDRGGPHRSAWTSFQKTRLNCSVPGEYPFYFDEIQDTTDVIRGLYSAAASSQSPDSVVYAVFTTSSNAIPGSAICAFAVSDIMAVFDNGAFKAQRDSTSNWLPVPVEEVPKPRPGACSMDSRTLPMMSVNFAKTHPLMDEAAPAMFGRPLLTHVQLRHRLTSIVVDGQVSLLGFAAKTNIRSVDVVFVGTDDGRVLKVASFVMASDGTQHTVTISQTQALPSGVAVLEMRVAAQAEKLIVVGAGGRIVGLPLYGRFKALGNCSACLSQLDPHWVWDLAKQKCRTVAAVVAESREVNGRDFLQVVLGQKKMVHAVETLCQRIPRSRDFDNEIAVVPSKVPLMDESELNVIVMRRNDEDDAKEIPERRHIVTLVDPMHQPLGTGGNEPGLITMANGSMISLMCILFITGLIVGLVFTRLKNSRGDGCVGCGGIRGGIGDEPSPYTTHSNHINAFDPSCEKQHLNSIYINRGCTSSTTTTTSYASTPSGDSSPKDLAKEINLMIDASIAAVNNNSSPDKYPNTAQQTQSVHIRLPSQLSIISEKHLADQLELELSTAKDRSHECNNSTERLDKEVAVSRMSDFTNEADHHRISNEKNLTRSEAIIPTNTGTLQKVKKTYI